MAALSSDLRAMGREALGAQPGAAWGPRSFPVRLLLGFSLGGFAGAWVLRAL